MSWIDLHFLRPLWFLALFAIPLAWWLVRGAGTAISPWRRVCDAALLPYLLSEERKGEPVKRGHGLRWIVVTGYVLAVIALAGPVWERLPQPVYQERSALIILLDLSRSMNAQDVRPSRLTRARYKVADMLNRRAGGLTALIAYADDAYSVVPLTDDVATILSQLPVLESDLMPAQGSRPERAIGKALDLFKQSSISKGDILLVTDEVTVSQVSEIKTLLHDSHYRLSVLGVGTPGGAPIPRGDGGFIENNDGKPVVSRLNVDQLQSLTAKTRGILQLVSTDDTDVDALTAHFATHFDAGTATLTELTTDRWREEGPWLLLPLLPLAAVLFRRGLIAVALLACMPWPQPAQAFDWSDLWQRPDQRGAAALARGDAKSAAKLFEDPRWGAVASYRAKEYRGALEKLNPAVTADDHYNLGNTLARLGRYPDAIAAYEQSLKMAPDNEDARYNRDLLLELLQQQAGDDSQGSGHSDPQSSADSQSAQSGSENKPGKQQNRNSSNSSSGTEQSPSSPKPETGRSQTRNESAKSLEELLAERKREHSEEEDRSRQQTPRQGESSNGPETTNDVQQEAFDRNREADQADEQWLRRIPDDPGGLLRRKFYYQYSQSNPGIEGDPPW